MRRWLAVAAMAGAMIGMLGGCVYTPYPYAYAYPQYAYPGYAYRPAYVAAPVVVPAYRYPTY